jgi:thymidylate kinase
VFREAFHQTRQAAVTPKLLILLDLSSEELVRRGDRHGQSDSELPTTEWFDRFRHGLSERATRPAQSPVLRLGAEDPDHMLAEVTAAIQAMQL